MAYTEKEIKVLGDVEHIRKRPGMYIGYTNDKGIANLLKEAVDNAVDEFTIGEVSKISVRIDTRKGSISVQDNGRGIPVGIHPKTKVSTLISVFTKLHSGGKFDSGAYAKTIGLHGVGLKAINALSATVKVKSFREGKLYVVEFARGKVVGEIEKKNLPGKGLEITFFPDPSIFKDSKVPIKWVENYLDSLAALCRGLKIFLSVDGKIKELTKKDGIMELLPSSSRKGAFVLFNDTADMALSWTGGHDENIKSYVNCAYTSEGGTHETALKRLIWKCFPARLKKDGVPADLYRAQLRAIIHYRTDDPLFDSQIKTKLANTDAEERIHKVAEPKLRAWFAKNKPLCEQIAELAEKLNHARALQGRIKAKFNNPKKLPPALLQSATDNPKKRELFIVEGESAGGTCIKARDANYQEVLPLKGKILNVFKARSVSQIMQNAEVMKILQAIGCKVTKGTITPMFRIGKLMLLMDADPDGKHITALVLALLIKFVPEMFSVGVYVVNSPLFVCSKGGKKVYTSNKDKSQELALKGFRVSRLKGHGEANADELRSYALDEETRKLTKVLYVKTDKERIENLLGKDVSFRKELLNEIKKIAAH